MMNLRVVAAVFLSSILGAASLTTGASAAVTPDQGVVSGDWVDHDFTTRDLQPLDGHVDVDTKLMGRVSITPGANNAGTVSDARGNVFMIEAITEAVNAYRGSISRSVRTGIETRVKFSSTDSTRTLFEMKSMTPPAGKGTWPSLLRFDAQGKIKDWKGAVVGVYAADRWYDISIDIDSPDHRYSVWLDGSPLITDLDLGNFSGILQSKIIQGTNPTKSSTTTSFEFLRAGTINPRVQAISVAPGTVETGKVHYPSATVTPGDAAVSGFSFASSDESVARPFGAAILGRNVGSATITATEIRSGATSSFELSVTDSTQPWSAASIRDADLASALMAGVRAQRTWTTDQILAKYPLVQTYMAMDEADFVRAVEADSARIMVLNTPSNFSLYARLFTRLFETTGDESYAKRSLLIMYTFALEYPRIVGLGDYGGPTASAAQPDMTWAFGAMFDMDVWGLLEPTVSGDDLKLLIQEVIVRGSAYVATDAVLSRARMDNRDPYSARPASVAALLLNDPILMRRVIDVYDRLLSPEHYYGDGLWHEETSAYSDQVAGNVATTIDVIKSYIDPAGFTDSRLGIVLDNTDLTARWPLLTKTRNAATEQLIYPDGTPIPFNDSDGKVGNPTPLPIVSKGLKNIEMGDTGYYALFQGDETEATHVGLYAPKTNRWGSGHHQFNFNRIDLWGAGVELLPYSGYVRNTSYSDGSGRNLRYPSMSPIWGNSPWVWRADGANQTPSEEWVRPAVLAYDDGSGNDKQVQLVETSVAGVPGKGSEVNRRLELMVNLGGNRNYTFDLSRLKGGQAHEIYQRGAELEPMSEQTNNIDLAQTGQPDLAAHLANIGKPAGYPLHRNWLLNPREGSGASPYDFTWTGAESGASLRTFMNGVPGSEVFMSQIPRTRVITTKSQETTLTAPHVTRRTILASPDQATQYGAVYEATVDGQKGLVSGVEWLLPTDGDDMTTIAKVRSGEFVDTVYISDDTDERVVDGITFSGSVAFVRTDALSGRILSTYVSGDGMIQAPESAPVASGTEQLRIIGATTSTTNTGLDPDRQRKDTVTLEGTFTDPSAVVGQRLLTRFGDGSGFSMHVNGIEEVAGNTVLTVESFTPFTVTDSGIETVFYPRVSIAGDAYAIVNHSSRRAGDPLSADDAAENRERTEPVAASPCALPFFPTDKNQSREHEPTQRSPKWHTNALGYVVGGSSDSPRRKGSLRFHQAPLVGS